MRHRRDTQKFGRTSPHRQMMLASLVCSLIERGRIRTTLEKAKAARSLADRMLTLGKKGTLHHRRLALATLRREDIVRKLFSDVAPRSVQRNGGYTRFVRLGQRLGDAAEIAILEWVDQGPATIEPDGKGKAGQAQVKPVTEKEKAAAK